MSRILVIMAIALYPPAWRRRYGGELAELAVRETASRRELWRTVVDLVRGAGAEWCRIAGLSGVSVTRRDAALGGWVAVLWSWAIFMVAGSLLQKGSEHWQSAMPPALRGDPEIVFGVLIAAAVVTAETAKPSEDPAVSVAAPVKETGGAQHFLIGKGVVRRIEDVAGEIIAEEGDVVTSEMIQKAKNSDQLLILSLNVE